MLFSSCKSSLLLTSKKEILVDKNAFESTKYLMTRLKEIPKTGYAFGHQDATAYGVDWKNDGSTYKSDVNDVSDDFPAVYGFEIGHIEQGSVQNLDSVNFNLMSKLIKKAHQSGGIITLSWHPDNPTTKKSAWDPSPAVKDILSGGVLNVKYQAWLAKVAKFLKQLKTKNGEAIPVVFRPFHEMNGSWFWWGEGNCTPEEFKKLWIQTYNILTVTHEVHNLIFCYSTDAVKNKKEYLKYYPGDQYVDILGMDLYHKQSTGQYVKLLNDNLKMLSKIGNEKSMPYALTEGGSEKIPVENWWTEVFHKNIRNKGISWALVWRNANKGHFYAPYPGQSSSEDFRKFKSFPDVLFLKDLKKIK